MADIALADLSNIGYNAQGQPDILDADLLLAQHNDQAVNVTGAQMKAFIDRNVMNVTATFIAPTATGTSSYDSNTGALALGIPKGNGIASIANTATVGAVDTYTITMQDGSTYTFNVTNGATVTSVTKTSSAGLVDTYTITMSDGSTFPFTVTNGQGQVDTVMGIQPVNRGIPAASIFNLIYPVGSYYWTSDGDFNPNGTFAGHWEQITDKVLVAKGTTYTGTGGVSQNTVDFSNGFADIGWGDNPSDMHIDGLYIGTNYDDRFEADHKLIATGSTMADARSDGDLHVTNLYSTKLEGTQILDNNMPYITAYCWHRDS